MATCWAAPIKRRIGATKPPANHSPIQIAANKAVSEIMKYMSPCANFRPPLRWRSCSYSATPASVRRKCPTTFRLTPRAT